MRRFASIAAIATIVALAPAAAAGESGPDASGSEAGRPAYRLSPELDVPLLLAPAAVSASWFLSFEMAAPYCAPRCDPDSVNFIDRPASGLYSTTWSGAGDVATVSVLLAMPTLLALGEGAGDGLNDLVVVAEATLFASATQVAMSFATSRPRPRLYGDDAPLDERDDGQAARSFFSGHTATAFAATLATFQTLRRVDQPALAWTALGLGTAGATFLSVARVGAGSHFPTDVAAGAAVGVAYGLLVPALHPKKSESGRATGALSDRVRVVPVVTERYGGGSVLGAL